MMTSSSTSPEDRASSSTARRRRGLAVVLFFLALTLVFSWPLPARMTTHLLARDPDIDLLMWALGWNAHAFLHQPFALFDANIFYPAKYALAYSENMIGSAVLTAPLIWLTGDLLLTMNVVQLSSVLLSALGAYLLGRRLGLGVPAALLTGIVFGFAPARFFRMPQAHLTTIQWLPFCLAYLHTYFGPGGRARDLRLAVFFFTAQALTSGHGAVFLTVAVLLYLGYRLGRGERPDIRRRIGDLGIPGALLLLPSVLIIGPYRAARLEAPSLARGLDDFGSSVSSYLSTPAHVHQWLLSLMPDWIRTVPPDAHLFPGVLPIVLALVAVAAAILSRGGPAIHTRASSARPDQPIVIYGAIAVVSAWFTLGPPLGLWRWTYWMPVFNFLRVPSRFVLLEMLALAVLSGFGYQWLVRHATPARQRQAAAAIGLLLLVEFAPLPMGTVPYSVEPPAVDRWLASQPTPFVVAEIPLPMTSMAGTRARRDARFMLHSTAHWQKTIHGYSGAEPPGYAELSLAMMFFPDERSLEAMADMGVTHVVVHPDLYPDDERDAAMARIDAGSDWLRPAYYGRDGRVYRLVRPPIE